MKRIASLMSTVIMMAVLTIVLSITSCQKESLSLTPTNISGESGPNGEIKTNIFTPLKVDLRQGYMQVTNASGAVMNSTMPGPTPLYIKDIPLLAPDGHQLTLAEFSTVNGWANFRCSNTGTHVGFHIKGLIPNGMYTMWIYTFKEPGADETLDNRIGAGAYGEPDGSNNSFVASADGTCSMSIKLPEGSLGGFGTVGTCLSTVFESHIVVAYHPDRHTHGDNPGPLWVGQMYFPVFGSQF